MIGEKTLTEYHQIITNGTLTPHGRYQKVLQLLGRIAGTAAFFYLNVLSAKSEISVLSGKGNAQPEISEVAQKTT
jgi:hypothetical protein